MLLHFRGEGGGGGCLHVKINHWDCTEVITR